MEVDVEEKKDEEMEVDLQIDPEEDMEVDGEEHGDKEMEVDMQIDPEEDMEVDGEEYGEEEMEVDVEECIEDKDSDEKDEEEVIDLG
ncbi:hypothetical protein DUI87_17658 [Hirundo rustica rustica]|uniref:Uncharacterized protein n=1 Tax=Hirundo rustica rustica TaxID=333673 RepID=A0A3M0JYW1_HIRRU|nr:hypothetical protein DUI87_17658 [Hirundo rustica rustica]